MDKKLFVKKVALGEGLTGVDMGEIKKEITASLKGSGYKLDTGEKIVYCGYEAFVYWPCVLATVNTGIHSTTGSEPESEDN